jgi:hypothetical protein
MTLRTAGPFPARELPGGSDQKINRLSLPRIGTIVVAANSEERIECNDIQGPSSKIAQADHECRNYLMVFQAREGGPANFWDHTRQHHGHDHDHPALHCIGSPKASGPLSAPANTAVDLRQPMVQTKAAKQGQGAREN